MSSAAVQVVTLDEARADPDALFRRAVSEAAPTIVARPDGESVVVLSLAEWNSLQETGHLNSTEANRRALDASIAQAERGEFVTVRIGDDGAPREVESSGR